MDYHLHSTYSDSSDSIREVLERAAREGLHRISFVDHDTTETYEAAKPIADSLGLELIPGVEISAFDFKRKRRVHVLGYNYHLPAEHIKAVCDPILERRNARSEWQVKCIIEAGYSLDKSKLRRTEDSHRVLYKQHIMEALTDAPYNSEEYQDLYGKLFKVGGLCVGSLKYADAFEAARAIKADGGYVVIAHPGQKDSYEIIEELAEKDLIDGIEKFHPDHDLEDYRKIDKLVEKYDLFITGGSDNHGSFSRRNQIGAPILKEK